MFTCAVAGEAVDWSARLRPSSDVFTSLTSPHSPASSAEVNILQIYDFKQIT